MNTTLATEFKLAIVTILTTLVLCIQVAYGALTWQRNRDGFYWRSPFFLALRYLERCPNHSERVFFIYKSDWN